MSEAAVTTIMGSLEAMLGNFEEGRKLAREGRAALNELGFVVFSLNMGLAHAMAEFHGDDLGEAERVLDESTKALDAIAEMSSSSLQHAVRSWFLARLGRFDEALELAERTERTASAVLGRACAMSAHALVLSAGERHDEAEAIGREAVELMSGTGDIHGTAMAYESLAEVLAAAGKEEEARVALEDGRRRYAQKGCTVCATRTAGRLEALVA
jgi:tetratricopeptide (TPR) repeat protein